jgi:hypothetical protein
MSHSGVEVPQPLIEQARGWLNYIVLVGNDLPKDITRIMTTYMSRVEKYFIDKPRWEHRVTLEAGHW